MSDKKSLLVEPAQASDNLQSYMTKQMTDNMTNLVQVDKISLTFKFLEKTNIDKMSDFKQNFVCRTAKSPFYACAKFRQSGALHAEKNEL